MNGNGVPVGGVPLLGQQHQQAAAMAQQLFLGMYVPLLPKLAIYRLAHGYSNEDGMEEAADPQRIAAEATAIVAAGMEQLGFKTERRA